MNFLSAHVVGEQEKKKGLSSTNTGLGPVDYVIKTPPSRFSSVRRDLCWPSVFAHCRLLVHCLPTPPVLAVLVLSPDLTLITFITTHADDGHPSQHRFHSRTLVLSTILQQLRWPQTGRSTCIEYRTSNTGHLIESRLVSLLSHIAPPPAHGHFHLHIKIPSIG